MNVILKYSLGLEALKLSVASYVDDTITCSSLKELCKLGVATIIMYHTCK